MVERATLARAASGHGRQLLLSSGIAAAVLYVITDIAAAAAYPGYSYADQAVSELFAIGAPTSRLVVPLFSLSSALLLAFGIGILRVDGGRKAMRWLAWMFAASAVDALLLWNFFPMHMRGAERTFTDLMHLILATNPFVLGTLVVAVFAFRDGFRWFSAFILGAVLLLAFLGFSYATAVDMGGATPSLGLIERLGQYSYQVWQIALALLLLRRAWPFHEVLVPVRPSEAVAWPEGRLPRGAKTSARTSRGR